MTSLLSLYRMHLAFIFSVLSPHLSTWACACGPVSASLNRQQCPHLLTPYRCLKGGRNAFSLPLRREQKLTCRLCKKRQHKFSSLSLSLSFSSHSLQALTLTLTRERRMSDTCLYTSSGAAKKETCLPSFFSMGDGCRFTCE